MATVTVTDDSVLPKTITVDGDQTITITGAKPEIVVVRDTLTIESGTAEVSSVNGQTGIVVLDTDDISEGTTNKYYATSLFNTDLATKTTSNLTEGTNLYYTNARADARVNLQTGANLDLSSKDTDDLSQGTTNLYYADSLVDSHLTGGTGVTYSAGDISIGQSVATTDDVTFNTVTATDEFIGHLDGSVRFTGKNVSGGTILPGQVIYISGLSGNTPEVDLAQSNSASTMPAFGIAVQSINDNASGQFATFGSQTGLNVANWGEGSLTFSVGDVLYVSSTEAGHLTNVAPTGESSLIQNIGNVERATPTTNTTIKVAGAGRTNATPNLNDGNIFIGNGSNQSSTASLDTSVGNLGYITASSTNTLTNKSGNISQWTNDAGYITSATDSQTLSFSNPDLSISNGNSVDLSALTPSSLPFSSITSTPTTLAGYGITDGVTGDSSTTFTNKSGNISQWTNDSGYITASSTDTLTNKSGNVSQFTNDSNYLVNISGSSINDLSDVDTTGLANTNVLKYNSTSGNFEPGATGITEVSQDSTPQLGGALDAQTNNITGVGALDATSLEASGDITVGGSIVGDSAALDIKNGVDGANIQFFIDDTTGSSHVPIKMEQYATIRPDDSTAYDSVVTMQDRGFRNGTLEFSTTGDQPDNHAGDYEINGFLATSTGNSWTGINLVSTGQADGKNPLYDRGIGSLQEFPQNVIFLSSANGPVDSPTPLGEGKRVFQLGAFVYDGVKFGGADSIPSFAITCTATETASSSNARGVKTTFEFLKTGGTGSDGDNSNDRNSTLTLDYDGADIAGDLVVTGDQIDFTNLPTSDPTSAGRLWNDSGTVKISAG